MMNPRDGLMTILNLETRWEDVPEDWICPDCDAGKEDFEMIEM